MKYINRLLIIIILVALTSCKKEFLDVNNTQNLFRESYVKDLSSMQDYVNGTYVWLAAYFEEGMASVYPELISDNIRPINSSINMMAHYNWVQKSDGADGVLFVGTNPLALGMDPLWRSGYTIIRACNFAIEDVDKYRTENPAKADFIKGQALAVRAYVMLKLVNIFAQPYAYTTNGSHPGIPYITTSDITKPFSRQTVAEVYNNLVTDLNSAIELLPTEVSDLRYMNHNAARALLARVYLFKEDFANAKALATQVTNDVPLMTIAEGYPDNIYKFKSPAQTETLFQLTPFEGPAYFTLFLNFYLRPTSYIQFLATTDISTILTENPNDVRQAWVTDAGGEWNITKFPSDAAPEVPSVAPYPDVAYYPALLRSSEMFLTVAEAAAKTNDEGTARQYLNLIRKRADPSIADISPSGAALLQSIYKERRKELAFESIRMFDLQRLKMGVSRTDVLADSPASLPFPDNKAIAPIPVTDVKLAGLTQNQGY